MDFTGLPGGDLIATGLDDLAQGRETIPSLLVTIGAPRLRRLGFAVPQGHPNPEHRLFALLARTDPAAAHSRYNAWIRRLVSFPAGSRVRELADRERIQRLMAAFGRAARADVRVHLVGSATAVLVGWRASTIDVDLVMCPTRMTSSAPFRR